MFCINCGTKKSANSIFCHNCGNKLIQTETKKSKDIKEETKELNNSNSSEINNVESAGNSKAIIKCGNCDYIGTGKLGRSIWGQILAWICIIFLWPITLIYYLATSKYRCPKCNSNFLGVKNKHGVFAQHKKSGVLAVILVIFIIMLIGLLSTLAVIALNNARIKSRDATRISDIKQIQAALDLYYDDYKIYPNKLYDLSGQYFTNIPNNPKPNDGDCDVDFEYEYTQLNNGMSYYLDYCLGEDTNSAKTGYNTATPKGLTDDNSLYIPN